VAALASKVVPEGKVVVAAGEMHGGRVLLAQRRARSP
jgi:hypothetical protein